MAIVLGVHVHAWADADGGLVSRYNREDWARTRREDNGKKLPFDGNGVGL